MAYVRLFGRSIAILFVVLAGIPISFMVMASRQRIAPTWGKHLWCRMMCRAAGVKINVKGRLPSVRFLGISNHISFVDVLVLGAIQPSHFLSKSEVKDWPLIGWLVKHNGTLFIERGTGLVEARHRMADYLSAGYSMLFFPEGMTTDGASVRRFFPQMLAAAHEANVLIQPMVLHYYIEESGHKRRNEEIAYIEGRSIAAIAKDLLKRRETCVDISVLAPYQPEDYTPKQVAKLAHRAVQDRYLEYWEH